jgi:hypothetical protein
VSVSSGDGGGGGRGGGGRGDGGTATGCAAQQRRPPFVDRPFGLEAQGREWVSQQYFSSNKDYIRLALYSEPTFPKVQVCISFQLTGYL